MKLTPKFTLALVAGVLVIQIGFGALRVQRERDLFLTDVGRDDRMVGRALALAAEREVKSSGVEDARRMLAEVDQRDTQVRIRWVDLGPDAPVSERPQAPLAILGPLARGEQVVAQIAENGGNLSSYSPVMLPGGGYAAIEVSNSLADERDYVGKSIRNAVLSTAALVALCGLMGWALGHLLIGRPVRLLVERARAIGGGDLEGAVVLAQRDELGDLADEMNAMASALAGTQRRLAEEADARVAVLEQLKHADRLRTVGTLASGIAHELGTPLNVIEGHAQLIAENDAAGDEVHDAAAVIKRQCKRMTGIIRQLLDFARREQSHDGSCDALAAARHTLDMIAPFAKKRGVKVLLEGPETLGEVSIPRDELVQVLSNLVINAIQANPEGGEVRITLAAVRVVPPWTKESERAMIRFVVSDDGCGMDEATRERVFEPFFTTKSVGEGTGLGLSVAYGIIAERGGFIDVTSDLGTGTAFSIFIPAFVPGAGNS